MKKLVLLILTTFIFLKSFSQIEPITGLTYLDNGKFDKNFREYHNINIPSSYFVITFDPTLSSLTLVPEVIKAYTEMRLFAKFIPIYIVYINNGVVSKEQNDEEKYFNEIFYINKNVDKNVHYIQDAKLYNLLNVQTLMTKWFYIYNYRLIGGANSIKLHSLSDNGFNLPKDIIGIGEPKKTKIYPDSLRLSTNRDIIRPYYSGKLLYITDMKNNINVLNVETGRFEKKSNKSEFDYLNFYCRYISANEKNCEIAKKNNENKYNRDPNYFSGASFKDNFIYVSTGFEVTVPWESSVYSSLKYMTYVNELGEKQQEKYNLIGEAYPAILKFDTSLNYLSAYYINTRSYPKENLVPKKAGFWCGLDRGFYIKDSLLIVDNNPDASLPLKVLPKIAEKSFSVFKLGLNNTFYFEKFLPTTYDKSYLKYMNWHSRTNYFTCDGQVFGNLLNGGVISNLSGNFMDYKLLGLGDKPIQEKIPAFAEDNIKLKINYRSLCINSILNDRFILAIYYYQDKPVFELLEIDGITKNLKTIQVTSLEHVKGFEELELNATIPNNGDGLCISNNKIYMTAFENGEYFLYEYPIVLKKKLIQIKKN